MQVTKYHLCDMPNSVTINREKKEFAMSQIQLELKELIKEVIVSNTDVRIEVKEDDKSIYEPKGQPLEVGMINFLFENDVDVQNMFITRN